MFNNEKAYITFGSQMGGEKAAEAVQPHLIALRRLLKKHCNSKYVKGISELAPIGRIDGDISYWEFEGCQRMRINKREQYITIDIGMPKSRWEGRSNCEIRQYLVENLKQALKLMVTKLKKEKYAVDEAGLFSDFAIVEQKYLACDSEC